MLRKKFHCKSIVKRKKSEVLMRADFVAILLLPNWPCGDYPEKAQCTHEPNSRWPEKIFCVCLSFCSHDFRSDDSCGLPQACARKATTATPGGGEANAPSYTHASTASYLPAR